jgi:hypothetical protein
VLLSARLLNNIKDVNTFEVVPVLEFTAGDNPVIGMQLVDASLNRNGDPPYRRYVPAASSALIVTIKSVRTDVTITRNALQPYPTLDGSIWTLQLIQGIDPISSLVGTYALKLDLVQGGVHTFGWVSQALDIASTTPEF